MKISFGKIASFDAGLCTGTINVAGEPVPASFSKASLRNVLAGHSAPELRPIENWTGLTTEHISVGDDVVVHAHAYYKWESTPNKRTLRRAVDVLEWALVVSYYDAWRIIKTRPVFEVVEFVLYNGKPTTGEQRRVIARGTAIELQAKYPRGVALDPLAPEKESLGFTYVRRWYRIPDDQQSSDPRPLPAGQKAEPFRPTNNHGLVLATGAEVAIGLDSRLRVQRRALATT